MATNPPPPRPAPGSAGAQLISLFESLPSLIAQVRAGKLSHQTVIQLRLIIPKHRKEAAEYLVRKGQADPFINLPDTLDPEKPLPASWSKYVEEVNKNMGGTRQGNATKPPGPNGGPGPRPGPAPGGPGGAAGPGATGGPSSASGGSSSTGAGGSNPAASGSAPMPTNPAPSAPSNQAAMLAARPTASAPSPQVSSLPMGTARPLPMSVPHGSPAVMRPRPQPRPQAQTPRPPQQNQARPPSQAQARPPGQTQARPPPQTQIRPPGLNQQLPQGANQPRPPQGIPPAQMAGGAKAPINRSRPTSEAPNQGGGKKPNSMAPGDKYTWAEVFKLPEDERNAWFAEEPKAKPAWDNIMVQVQINREKMSASRSASPAPDAASVRPPQMGGGVPVGPGLGVRPPGIQMQSGPIGKAAAPGQNMNPGPLNAGPGSVQAIRPMGNMNTSLPNPSNLPNQSANLAAQPPINGPRPQQPGLMTATANQNPNTAAADILAKNPPPVINLNLPSNRVAPPNDNKQKPQEAASTGTSGGPPGKWNWLRNCNPKPPSAKPASLSDKNIEWYITVNEKQFPTLTPEQQQMYQWIWGHVKKRRQIEQQQQQQQQQRQQLNQPNQPNPALNGQQGQQGPPGQQGPGQKARQGPNPNPVPKQMTKDNLAAEISRLKEGGKQITMESIKELCKSTDTPWTAELEKHLEPFCVPARPVKTHRQIFTEGIHELAMDVTGQAIDEGMEKFFMGLAEDLYSDNVRGACFAAQARNKEDTSVSVKDMGFHMRHKHDRITAGYGQEVVIAGTKRKHLLGYKPEAVKRIKDTREAQHS